MSWVRLLEFKILSIQTQPNSSLKKKIRIQRNLSTHKKPNRVIRFSWVGSIALVGWMHMLTLCGPDSCLLRKWSVYHLHCLSLDFFNSLCIISLFLITKYHMYNFIYLDKERVGRCIIKFFGNQKKKKKWCMIELII